MEARIANETKIDDVDWRLIDALQEDARVSFAELGRRLGLSAPAVAERVRRLEASGVITGYHATVAPERVGMEIQAVIRVATNSSSECLTIGDKLRAIPEVLACYRITGSDSHIVRVACRSIAHLDAVLSRVMPERGETVTSVVLTAPVTWRPISRELAEG